MRFTKYGLGKKHGREFPEVPNKDSGLRHIASRIIWGVLGQTQLWGLKPEPLNNSAGIRHMRVLSLSWPSWKFISLTEITFLVCPNPNKTIHECPEEKHPITILFSGEGKRKVRSLKNKSSSYQVITRRLVMPQKYESCINQEHGAHFVLQVFSCRRFNG